MNEIRSKVVSGVLALVREKQPNVDVVKPDDRLAVDLGLKSLDLARLVARLEIELDQDPFLERVAITSVRTVEDLCRAYESGPSPTDDDD